MSKRAYTPEEKKLVRRLLLIHQGDVAVVHNLTGFPRRTIERWRARWDDDYQLYAEALAQNDRWRANANRALPPPSIPAPAPAEPLAQSADSMAQFADLRQTLMNHVIALANNLPLHDSSVNQRVQAISRLLDRILTLDEFLPSQQPQQPQEHVTIKRAEFVYDGAVHSVPPWQNEDARADRVKYFNDKRERSQQQFTAESAEENENSVVAIERRFQEMEKRLHQESDAEFADVEQNQSVEPDSANPDPFSLF